MRASWSAISSDKNSSQVIKKESISVYIKNDGTVRLSGQDESKYKKGEINFNGCCVLIGGISLEDALAKGRWLYCNNQISCDNGYYSREVSPERKTSIFNSDNNLVNLDTCKVNQESNENLLMNTDTKQSQYVDSPDDLSVNTSDFNLVMNLFDEVSNDIAEIGKEKKVEEKDSKMEEENKEYLRKSNANKLHAKLSKGKRCTYEQQMTIACGISVDNSQTSFEYSDQNNNVTANNTGSFIDDQYYEKMNTNSRDLTIYGTPDSKEKVAEWLDNMQSGHSLTESFYNNDSHSGKGSFNPTISNITLSSGEPDRSSVNSLSWDNNTLDLNDNDIELDYNPPRRTQSFNSKHRSNSVPTRLVTLREDPDNSQKNYNLNESFVKPTIKVTYPEAECDISSELDTSYGAPDNNPNYNLNKSCIYSIARDPNKNITKFGMFCI
ncbi:MAG: hypothetical protein U0X86_000373 [Wolbachia endosymbiont of Xenopsylla cheopis]